MIIIRSSRDRGHSDRGWLDSYHTFSFGEYSDPVHMGFHSLRVLNDDRVAAGRGFGAHAHRDMEILTYVLDGSLLHRDSTGQLQTFGPNTIQVMSAGDGIIHSEFNASETDPVHFLQIWIEPAVFDVKPSYQQILFGPEEKLNRLRLLAGPDQGEGSAAFIHQDARVYAAEIAPNTTIDITLGPGRHGWLQVARGSVNLQSKKLEEGDGAAISEEAALSLLCADPAGCEILFFDLP